MTWKTRLLRIGLWGLTLPLIVLNGWVLLLLFDYFHAIITMVVVATLLAFVLEYPVAWLQRFRLRRPRAVGLCHRFGHLRPLVDSSFELLSSKALFHKGCGVLGAKLA